MFIDVTQPKKKFYLMHHESMKKFWKAFDIDTEEILKLSWVDLYKKMPKTKKEIKDLVYKLKN